MAEELKDQVVLKHEDGILEHDGKKYIVKDSYDVVATKARERKEALEKIEADKKAQEEADAAKKGEWEKIAKDKEAEIEALKKANVETAKRAALKDAASKMGAANTDTVARLVDIEKIELDEKGEVKAESITAILDGMKTSDPYLFAAQEGDKAADKGGSGTGGAPDNGQPGTTQKVFKRSELTDSAFYQANREEILTAQKEGRIVDDITA